MEGDEDDGTMAPAMDGHDMHEEGDERSEAGMELLLPDARQPPLVCEGEC